MSDLYNMWTSKCSWIISESKGISFQDPIWAKIKKIGLIKLKTKWLVNLSFSIGCDNFLLIGPLPLIAGRYLGQAMSEGYLPTMKQVTSLWRRGGEGGAVMSDVKVRCHTGPGAGENWARKIWRPGCECLCNNIIVQCVLTLFLVNDTFLLSDNILEILYRDDSL